MRFPVVFPSLWFACDIWHVNLLVLYCIVFINFGDGLLRLRTFFIDSARPSVGRPYYVVWLFLCCRSVFLRRSCRMGFEAPPQIPAFLWSRYTTGLVLTLGSVGVSEFQRLHPHFRGPALRQAWCEHSDIGVRGKLKMAAITGSTYEKTQYLCFNRRLQRNCDGSILIVWVNELNGTGVNNVDVGYVCTSGLAAVMLHLSFPVISISTGGIRRHSHIHCFMCYNYLWLNNVQCTDYCMQFSKLANKKLPKIVKQLTRTSLFWNLYLRVVTRYSHAVPTIPCIHHLARKT